MQEDNVQVTKKDYWKYFVAGILLPIPLSIILGLALSSIVPNSIILSLLVDPFILSAVLPAIVIYFLLRRSGQKYAIVRAGVYFFTVLVLYVGIVGLAMYAVSGIV